jgi:hypothetical protein
MIKVNESNVLITTGTAGSDMTQDFVVRNGYMVPASKRAVDAFLSLSSASKRAADALFDLGVVITIDPKKSHRLRRQSWQRRRTGRAIK